MDFIDPKDVLERLHNKINKRGINGLRKYSELMRQADEDPEREIDLFNEFPDLLASSGIYLNKTEQTCLAQQLDDGEGKATFEEIMNILSPSLDFERLEAVNDAFEFFSKGEDTCPSSVIGEFRFKRDKPLTFAIKKTPTTKLLNGMIIVLGKSEDDVTREDFENYFRANSYLAPEKEEFIKILKDNIKKAERN